MISSMSWSCLDKVGHCCLEFKKLALSINLVDCFWKFNPERFKMQYMKDASMFGE